MSYFEIIGGKKLSGEIKVSGAKNAAMKIIAASVMIPGKITLENVPDILDIQTIIDILSSNGAEIIRTDHTLRIDTTNLADKNPDINKVRKMRGSIVLIGPYLNRFGQISIAQPGGCAIGTRPIDIHLDGFRQLGAEIHEEDGLFNLKNGNKKGTIEVNLTGVSVTATENMIMMAVLMNEASITLKNVAQEPEIGNLIDILNACGANITSKESDSLKIVGVAKLQPTTHTVLADRIETGTFIAMAVVTNSSLKISHCVPQHIDAFLKVIEKMGVKFSTGEDFISVTSSEDLRAMDITTEPYPGFPTDLQAPMGIIMTQAKGKSHIDEAIFENRLGYLKELEEMGAEINISDEHHAEITGPCRLKGKKVESLDLRAGATLILAGLIAEGKTTITNAEIVDRGYESIEKRLQAIGANIKRITS